MNYDLAIASRRPASFWPAALAAVALALGGCASGEGEDPEGEETVLVTRSGETGIQVTESSEGGQRIVRVTTTFRGEESTVVLHIDEPVYEIDIPLSIQQVRPTPAGAAPGAPGGAAPLGVGDLLAAQYLEQAQKAMLDGDYNNALRQVNLVLAVKPDHIQGLMMKGSVYYAMGNYQLANQQWEQVLTVDPSNEEVREFQDFIQSQQGAPSPNLPGSSPGEAPGPPAPPTGDEP